eukprot:TRINITY_DN7646_c0_g1_i1.p1 TRINITY_DN7646_c0_g1~~TRINITY_DN7646_c0_g1_i1.p1  ORF type:complete len:659 (+),score=103.68 TRINITY_DN7646_c0_g1_i1:142-2118(+)
MPPARGDARAAVAGQRRPDDLLNRVKADNPGRARGYSVVRSVGKGEFGVALLVQDRSGNLRVMKAVDIHRLGRRSRKEAVDEVSVLSSLKHPYIVRYRESFIEGGTLAIVMDFAEGGDLYRRIASTKKEGRVFSEPQIVRWFSQAALGLSYLHGRNIMHRDVKSQNLFLTKDQSVRIGDFGISKVLKPEGGGFRQKEMCGTPYYLSPEICKENLYSFASDMWALGVVLHEMAALRLPFEAANLASLMQLIMRGTPPVLPASFSKELRRLGVDLFCRDYNKRPKASDVLQRSFIQTEVRRMLAEEEANLDNTDSVANKASLRRVGSEPTVRATGSRCRGENVSISSTTSSGSICCMGAPHMSQACRGVDGLGDIVCGSKPVDSKGQNAGARRKDTRTHDAATGDSGSLAVNGNVVGASLSPCGSAGEVSGVGCSDDGAVAVTPTATPTASLCIPDFSRNPRPSSAQFVRGSRTDASGAAKVHLLEARSGSLVGRHGGQQSSPATRPGAGFPSEKSHSRRSAARPSSAGAAPPRPSPTPPRPSSAAPGPSSRAAPAVAAARAMSASRSRPALAIAAASSEAHSTSGAAIPRATAPAVAVNAFAPSSTSSPKERSVPGPKRASSEGALNAALRYTSAATRERSSSTAAGRPSRPGTASRHW